MRLDIYKLKGKLVSGGTVLIDDRYLESDMKPLYEYFLESPNDIPDNMTEYINSGEFDSLEFLKIYLESICGFPISSDIDEEGWIILIKEI